MGWSEGFEGRCATAFLARVIARLSWAGGPSAEPLERRSGLSQELQRAPSLVARSGDRVGLPWELWLVRGWSVHRRGCR
jgi:hypothetical protein